MSKEGFISEDGQFYKWPEPMMDRDVSNETLQSWIDASLDVVEAGYFSERMVEYHKHLLHGYYSDILQERNHKGSRKRR